MYIFIIGRRVFFYGLYKIFLSPKIVQNHTLTGSNREIWRRICKHISFEAHVLKLTFFGQNFVCKRFCIQNYENFHWILKTFICALRFYIYIPHSFYQRLFLLEKLIKRKSSLYNILHESIYSPKCQTILT